MFLFFPLRIAYSYDKLCEGIEVTKLKKLRFSATERRFVCGDSESHAYKTVPLYEAEFFLRGFLQARGYLNPRFENKDDVLYVSTGRRSKVRRVNVISDDEELRKEIQTELRHLYQRRILNTMTLNSIEGEALAQVRKRGHPCAKVHSHVDVKKDKVFVSLERLAKRRFGEIKREKIEGLHENALDRYYAFKENEWFNADLLTLTERRMTRAEVVQGTYFLEQCPDNFKLSQEFILTPPRTIRFGAGVSTELGPMLRLKWSNNRYKSMASVLSLDAQTSFRSQSLTISADSFFWNHEPRRSLLSVAQVIRESQVDYEQFTYSVKPLVKWTRDSEGFEKTYTLGPSYEAGTYHSKDDPNTKSFSAIILQGSLQWMSHIYELFDIHPDEGSLFGMNFDFRHPYGGFSDPLLRLDTSFTKLSRITNWDKGTIVGAMRVMLGTTWINSDTSLQSLPPAVKFYGGGSDDIRGYYYRTLPQNDGLGALSKGVLKLELRRTHLIRESIEGFVFVDGGYFSDTSWKLNDPLFYSPGLGIRWLLPFGLVQGFWARAYRENPYKDQGNLFYVGVGSDF